MATLVYVANEAVYPPRNGGTVRIAGMVEQLERAFSTVLLDPASGAPAGNLRGLVSLAPRLGWVTTGAIDAAAAARLPPGETAATMVSHSYLAPFVKVAGPLVVDFANLEVDRQRHGVTSVHLRERGVSAIEWLKARAWEPQVARAAAVCVAVSPGDAERLERWGATCVIEVPNAANTDGRRPSPAGLAPVGLLASGRYLPNVEAMRWLVRSVWPRVVEQVPAAELHIAGHGTEELAGELTSDSVRVLGSVDDAAAFYDSCALVAAPVQRGGGTQLKVIEALARGRCIVASPHSTESLPAPLRAAIDVAPSADEFAARIVVLLQDTNERRRREAAVAAAPVLGWEAACRPLVEHLARMLDQ